MKNASGVNEYSRILPMLRGLIREAWKTRERTESAETPPLESKGNPFNKLRAFLDNAVVTNHKR